MAKNKNTYVDFTRAPGCPLLAKNTNAIVTAANAQQDYFYVNGKDYFEVAQGVGAIGANTLFTTVGLTPGGNGWLLTCDNTATDSIEITRGIVSGSAQSFVIGTDPAFFMRVAILIGTRANVTHLTAGFRKMVAYETASTAAEMKTAYDDKAVIGLVDNAGAKGSWTSVAGADTGPTAFAATAHTNGDLLALQLNVSAAGVTTYKLASATPAGATAAQLQTAVTTAYAALAADANALAYTFTAALEVVPAIFLGASGAAAPDARLVAFECGYQ